MESSTRTCAHPACRCEVPAGQTYCGPHCANKAADPSVESEIRCGCGHAGCSEGGEAGEPHV
jgi:hypothetical protein